MGDARLLGIDWGTSNLRVHRLDAAGAILETRRSDAGILSVPPGGFEAILRDLAGDWLTDGLPALACGMVGSRQGWAEAPYVPCPAGLEALAAGLVRIPLEGNTCLWLVPGAVWRDADGAADVIRGEETKIVGAAGDLGDSALVCLPGTHAKWARVAGGALESFRTAMSGEVYRLLLEHSILGRMARADAPFDPDAFRRGVARAGLPGGLLHHLFSVRTVRLFDDMDEAAAASYLSGVVVGADVAAMADAGFNGDVCLVGEGGPCDAYRHALEALGRGVTVVPGDAAVGRGLARLAAAAGLVGS